MPRFAILPPLSLYVHFPWCVRKCPYCDFNSHATRGAVPERAYVDALLRDLDTELPTIEARRIETVFFGGGTPSLFSPESIASLLDGVRAHIAVADDAEITLEANPGTVDVERFKGFRDAGVNRLSIGIQSFDDEKLKILGRIHGRDEALRAAEAAHAAGFDNYNLDLMFGLPGQTLEQAMTDVRTAIALQPTHLSAYQLTIEPNTLFHARPPVLPDDDAIWDMQQAIQAELATAGFRQYEVSAYAKPGRACRHNLNYWEFGDYLGIGAGAHGKLTNTAVITRRWKRKHPEEYLAKAGTGSAIGGEQSLSARDALAEFMLNALRLTNGFPTALFTARTGLSLDAAEAPLREARHRGLLAEDGVAIQPTERGRRFLNNLVELFV
ncbi:MAG: oxygen-independent coproporphyrinogen III oxidase-like protein [Gammaproteobacteria bacterium]|nr:MAG: oxygen-independent coproporphyrinogen III oxidase-like protein [Gammaproteobacteria bacterium]